MLNSIRSSIVVLFLVVFSAAAVAATTVPYTFTAGTPAKASEVNADFQALVTAIDALSARVSKLDGTSPITASDLAGTYSLDSIGIMLSVDAAGGTGRETGLINAGVHIATVTLASNGTGTLSVTSEQNSTLAITSANSVAVPPTSPSATLTSRTASLPGQTFTWSLSGSSIIMSGGSMSGTYLIVSGGRLLINASTNNPAGYTGLALLTRIN